jgi:hypothetical protein
MNSELRHYRCAWRAEAFPHAAFADELLDDVGDVEIIAAVRGFEPEVFGVRFHPCAMSATGAICNHYPANGLALGSHGRDARATKEQPATPKHIPYLLTVRLRRVDWSIDLTDLLHRKFLAELGIAGEFLRAELPGGNGFGGLSHFLILVA